MASKKPNSEVARACYGPPVVYDEFLKTRGTNGMFKTTNITTSCTSANHSKPVQAMTTLTGKGDSRYLVSQCVCHELA
ncbi:hypothetical protein PQX77_021875 [Marasmius sp. AFHP31]|nr:hypothetical protein PQX77_021875 [Marasmius sp. AFHP31]